MAALLMISLFNPFQRGFEGDDRVGQGYPDVT